MLVVVPADALADPYATPYGEWRGKTQYQAKAKGKSDAAAHSVIPLILNIEPGGRVTGGSPDNGCRLLGIAAPGVAPYIVKFDITLTGNYAGFNRTYQGHLSVFKAKKYAKLSLVAMSVAPGTSGTITLQAPMRR